MNRNQEGIIEFLYEGGSGSEARVIVELRSRFPGIGGTIITQEGAVTALRIDYSNSPKIGHRTFLVHAVIKKLEDYFFRKGSYIYPHIPRPLGSISTIYSDEPCEGYLYEWVVGHENFPWEISSSGSTEAIKLRDWDKFVGCFNEAGINMTSDVTDPDNGNVSKNIIHQFPQIDPIKLELTPIWKRIDFGSRSAPIDFEKLSGFLNKNSNSLVETLRYERVEMLELIVSYLRGKELSGYDVGRLEMHIGDYRHKSLMHYISRGSGAKSQSAHFGGRQESLL